MEISQKILSFMEEKGVTAYKLAKDIDISESTISKWKTKPTSKIDADIIGKIANYFNISADLFLGCTQEQLTKNRITNLLNKENLELLGKDVGIKSSILADLAMGNLIVTKKQAEALANYFNVTTEYLLGKTDDPSPPEKDITFDDFTFAFHEEAKYLTQEQKDNLLEMARIMNKKIKEREEGK